MKSLVCIVLVALFSLPVAVLASSHEETGEKVYKKSCAMCHDSGVMGAPKTGDNAAWTARIADGMEKMYEAAIKGKGTMPAKGGNSSLSDAEVKAAVDYMVEESK